MLPTLHMWTLRLAWPSSLHEVTPPMTGRNRTWFWSSECCLSVSLLCGMPLGLASPCPLSHVYPTLFQQKLKILIKGIIYALQTPQLDKQLPKGRGHISVFPAPVTRPTLHSPWPWQPSALVPTGSAQQPPISTPVPAPRLSSCFFLNRPGFLKCTIYS